MTRKLELYRSVLHPTLAAAIASLFLISALYLSGGIIPGWTPPALLAVLVIVAATVEAVIGNILEANRVGAVGRIRELAILLFVLYPVVSLCGSGPLLSRFTPAARHVGWLAVAACSWTITFFVHRLLRGREGLLNLFKGRRGEPLRAAIIERQRYMASIVRELRRARNTGGSFAVLLAGLMITGAVIGGGSVVSPAGFVFFVLYTVTYLAALAVVNGFIDEYAANGEGLSVPAPIIRRRFLTAMGVVLVAAVGAFVLSRNSSVLSLELFARFFKWLSSLFQPAADPEPPDVFINRPAAQPTPDLLEMLQEMEERRPSLLLQILVRLLQRTVVAIAAAGIVVFVFGPLFSKNFRERLRTLRPWEALRAAWRRLTRRASLWWRFLRWRLRHRRAAAAADGVGPDEAALSQTTDPELQRFRKRRQTDRVVGSFLAVVRWAQRRGFVYRRSQGAGEFLAEIEKSRPELNESAATVTAVFNEAKYSTQLVPFARMRSYQRAVRQIVRSKEREGDERPN